MVLERGPAFNFSEFLPPAQSLQTAAKEGKVFEAEESGRLGLVPLSPALEILENKVLLKTPNPILPWLTGRLAAQPMEKLQDFYALATMTVRFQQGESR